MSGGLSNDDSSTAKWSTSSRAGNGISGGGEAQQLVEDSIPQTIPVQLVLMRRVVGGDTIGIKSQHE